MYSEVDLNEEIKQIIISHGFDPESFEFKSSTNYSKEPEKIRVRDSLKLLMQRNYQLGIVIIPREYRKQLGTECLKALKQFISLNNGINKPISIYFDEGMFQSVSKASELIGNLNFEDCEFHLEQDSKIIRGIQLADLCAHICARQFKDSLGLITKKVKAGPDSGYDPNSIIELGFEMWATLRYSFFKQTTKIANDDPIEEATLDVEPFGLYISTLCSEELNAKIKTAFGRVYLGCIH